VRGVAQDAVVEAWLTLPRRIYLDTGTLQTLYDYGETLWENEPFEPLRRDRQVPGLSDELDALRNIFLVNERAHFEFAVTEASLWEAAARNERGLHAVGRRRSRQLVGVVGGREVGPDVDLR
jgi:hypothetical protein